MCDDFIYRAAAAAATMTTTTTSADVAVVKQAIFPELLQLRLGPPVCELLIGTFYEPNQSTNQRRYVCMKINMYFAV